MCAINRSSIFFLLSIQIHLCDLVRSLYVDITVEKRRQSQGLIWKVLSVSIPCLLMAISYGGLFHSCMSWVAYGFLVSDDKRMPSVECHENCEISENYQLNVARHAFSCSMRFSPIWSRLVLLHAHYAVAIPNSKMCLFCMMSGFSTWAQNGVGITCTFFLSLFLSPLCATLMSLTILMGNAQIASVSAERTSVVRRSDFVYPLSPFFFLSQVCGPKSRGKCYVVLCWRSLSRYDVAKGAISFGAAHLRFCSAWFVTFLPLLLSLVRTKLVCIHLNFLPLIMGWSKIILLLLEITHIFLRDVVVRN